MKKTTPLFTLLLVIFILLVLLVWFWSPFETHGASRYAVQGIDISHYQESIDFEALKADPTVKFVFVKATEGISIKDKRFYTNWTALRRQKIIRGAYHFYRPSVKAKRQAEEFIKRVEIWQGDLPPVLDLEETDGRSKAIILKGVKIWLETIEEHYKMRPIIYVNQHFYKEYIQGNFDEYPIWIAAYRYSVPHLEATEWTFWQYSDEGRAAGIVGDVDRNVFAGDWAALQELLKK